MKFTATSSKNPCVLCMSDKSSFSIQFDGDSNVTTCLKCLKKFVEPREKAEKAAAKKPKIQEAA